MRCSPGDGIHAGKVKVIAYFAYYGRRHVDASCYAHDFHWLHVLFKSVCFSSGPFRISDSSAYLDALLFNWGYIVKRALCC